MVIRTFPNPRSAASWWLENHLGPRQSSLTDPARMPGAGRSLSPYDTEATLREIEAALGAVPVPWRPIALVRVGWGCGVDLLREGTYQRRAQLSDAIPPGLTRHMVDHHARQFEAGLLAHGLLDRAEAAATAKVDNTEASPTSQTRERRLEVEAAWEREQSAIRGEAPVSGWKAIAAHLGCGTATAKRRAQAGMPVRRPPGGGQPFVFPSEVKAWLLGAPLIEDESEEDAA